MTTLYKLTDSENQTKHKTQWGEGVTHSGTGEGELCGPGFIHAYKHPFLASFFNPIHAGFENPNLWEAEGDIALKDGQQKCGCVSLTTLKQIPLPEITIDQRREIGIRCALMVCHDPSFVEWANKWLSGEDRSSEAAEAAAEAADVAGEAAWAAASAWAWEAAEAAAASAAEAAEAAEAAADGKNLDILQIIKDIV